MPITEEDLAAARAAWGDALVAISTAYDQSGLDAARDLAAEVIAATYGHAIGPVLFKPTLSGGAKTFRTDAKGALSYFVGHDPDFPDDSGFALRGWRATRSETAAAFIDGDVAMWQGWFFFTDKDGQTIHTDKSFGYRKDAEGRLRVMLHHSSLPYEG